MPAYGRQVPGLSAKLFRVLVVVLTGTVVVQVLLALQADATGREFPEVEHLVVPYAAAAIGAVALLQVALFAGWRILSTVAVARLPSAQAMTWLDVIIVCTAGFSTLSLLVLLHVVLVVTAAGALLPLVACVVLGGSSTSSLIGVRDLLRTARAAEPGTAPAPPGRAGAGGPS